MTESNIETLFFKKTRTPKLLFIKGDSEIVADEKKLARPYVIMEAGGEVGIANCNDYESLGLLEEVIDSDRWDYIKKQVRVVDGISGQEILQSSDKSYTWLFEDIKNSIMVHGWIITKEKIWKKRLEELHDKVRGESMEDKG